MGAVRPVRDSSLVACFDLDRFKTVNDSLGHAAGDLVIRRFGEIVRGIVRASDLACRLGGEEFAALLPNTSAASARPVAERIRKALERERFEIDGKDFWVTVSAGVADAASSSGLAPGNSSRARTRRSTPRKPAAQQGSGVDRQARSGRGETASPRARARGPLEVSLTDVPGEIDRFLDEMIAAQRQRVLDLARRIEPGLPADDLLQPHDHPLLAASPDFNFEDGILAGYLAVRAALRASRLK